tara:strand:- start:605 stop:3532 length:2928 start_codon:yes stop_codon:yes gene_type:complete
MSVTRMELTLLDIESINKNANKAYKDDQYEFECIITTPKVNVDSFTRVMNLCRKKTCTGNWKNIKDRSKSLDITIGSYRVSIYGIHYIEEYFKTDKLTNLPSNAWNVIKKEKQDSEKLSIGCKINLKTENFVDKNGADFGNVLANWKKLKKTFRLKNRYSYLVDERYSVDLTVVKSGIGEYTLRDSNTLDATEKHEIEIEYVPNILNTDDRKVFELDNWKKLIETILCSFRNTWKIVCIRDIEEVERFYYKTILNNDSDLDMSIIKRNKSKYRISPNVISLSMDRLRVMKSKAMEYYVTPKSDGLRMTGIINKNGELYLFGSKSQLYQPTGYIFDEKYAGSIFDGEMINQTKDLSLIADYLVFDCYFYKGKDIRNKFFEDRLELAKEIIDSETTVESFNNINPRVILKKFISMTNKGFHSECVECFKDIDENIYENDGLIFTPNDKVGGNDLYDKNKTGFIKSGKDFYRMLKWKDFTFNSIDFKIRFMDEHERPLKTETGYVMTNFMRCSLSVTYDQEPQPFTRESFINNMNGTENFQQYYKKDLVKEFKPFDPEDESARYVKLPIIDGKIRCKNNGEWNGTKISNNDIVEMIYEKDADEEYRWIPIRVRKDKDTPNFYKVALDIWHSYYLPVTKEIMTGNEEIPTIDEQIDTYYNDGKRTDSNLRKFHRLCVKDSLFENTIGKTDGKKLLDIGSGRGGDIPRYFEYDAQVIGIDNSVDNLHHQNSGAYMRLFRKLKQNGINKKYDLNKIVFLSGDAGKLFTNSSTFDLPNSDGIYKNYVKDNKIFDKQHTFDVASVFFSLHYFFKNKSIFDNFLKNIAHNIKIGGYFAGCCYDGNIIHNKLNENKGMDLVYRDTNGTETLRIRKNYDGNFGKNGNDSSLGKEIHVLVQSIDMIHPEYLVDFEFFAHKMFELGFKNVPQHSKNFEHYYNNQKNDSKKIVLSQEEKSESFLNRTFVFQRFSYGPENINNSKILNKK